MTKYQSDKGSSMGDTTCGPLSKPDFKPQAKGSVKAQEYIGGLQYPDIQTKQK